jgi:two-component system phosphate regulon sensor histidine kinase PhoR
VEVTQRNADDADVLVLALLAAAAIGALVALAVVRLRARRRAEPLQEAERLKRELIAVVSHEFRTPLTSIRGYAQTLDERGERMDRSAVHSCLAAIEGQSRRLERIVSNVLSVGEEPAVEADAATDFGVVARLVTGDLRDLWGAEAERVALDVEPGLRLPMSATAASLVFFNLLDNALKFGRPGTPVRLRGRRHGTDLVFTVTDQGDPIPAGDLVRIFEPFVQADSSDTRPAPGMGLGLASVRRLVGAHEGWVEARNAPPDVVVTVTLPAADRAPAVIDLPSGVTT